MSDKTFELLNFEKKNTDPEEKIFYHITYMEGDTETVRADVIDPSYPPMLIFANWNKGDSINMVKAINSDRVFKIDVEYVSE